LIQVVLSATLLRPYCVQAWASEGFFSRRPLVDFSKRFSRGDQKWWNLFFPTRN